MRVVLPEQKPSWMPEEMWNALVDAAPLTFTLTEAEREVFRRPSRDNPSTPPDAANG